MTPTLRQIFEHNRWANLQLIDFCEQQDQSKLESELKGTFGSVLSTLRHILSAESRYVLALSKEPSPVNDLLSGDGFPGWDALRTAAEGSGGALINLAARSDVEMISREIQGVPYQIDPWVVLLQVINHGTEHRGQVATVLTQQGITPPPLDGWTYGEAIGGMRKV